MSPVPVPRSGASSNSRMAASQTSLRAPLLSSVWALVPCRAFQASVTLPRTPGMVMQSMPKSVAAARESPTNERRQARSFHRSAAWYIRNSASTIQPILEAQSTMPAISVPCTSRSIHREVLRLMFPSDQAISATCRYQAR